MSGGDKGGGGLFDAMAEAGSGRALFLSDASSGLRAIIVIDELGPGRAAGGIRTQRYPSVEAALADAQRLASSMTLKCAIAGLRCGGAKTVMMEHAGLDRASAFRRLGRFIHDLGGLYRTAGDLGTSEADLAAMAEETFYVNTTGSHLGTATGQTVVNGIRACVDHKSLPGLRGLRVAIQGCGLIGSGVARSLAAEGAELVIADLSPKRAEALAAEVGATVLAPEDILAAEVDIFCPCATGGTITRQVALNLKAWAICGGANNQLAEKSIAADFARAGILFVPDYLASSGAVILGIAGLEGEDSEPNQLIEQVYRTCREVLARADARGLPTTAIAEEIARERLEQMRR